MNSFDDDKVAFNSSLFKRLGFYRILAPHRSKVFNYNAYLLGLAIVIIFLSFTVILGSIGFFVDMEDIIDDIGIYQIIFGYINYFLSVFKICMFVHHKNEIWDLLDVTRLNFMTSKNCLEHINILHKYRRKSLKITNFFTFAITLTILSWWSFPIFINNFINTKSDDSLQRYENVINLRFPLSIYEYNNHYFYFIYIIEVATGAIIEYGILITDVILISISYVFIAHYEIHKMAFTSIGLSSGNEIDFDSHCEDFISVVIEQQKLHLKLKSYYSIAWPIIIATVVVTSGSIIILSYSFVVIFMTANAPILSVIKLGNAFFFLCIELFIHCYLLDLIQTKKESVTFGMYSCNWTPGNLKFQRLLLLSMRMNHADKLKIKITETNVINLKFFSDVMLTCYNIVSIMLKTKMED